MTERPAGLARGSTRRFALYGSDSTITAQYPRTHWGSCQNALRTPTIPPTLDRRPQLKAVVRGAGNRSVGRVCCGPAILVGRRQHPVLLVARADRDPRGGRLARATQVPLDRDRVGRRRTGRPTRRSNAVLDEFEKTAWAGLEPDRYSWTAVLHLEHGGGVHVHVLTARCDLGGKSLNIAPPGWQKTFDLLRGAFNHEHGWSRSDDPARARTQQPGRRAYIAAAKLRAGPDHEADPRELIRDYLVQRVEHGVVQSRADVVSALEDARLEVPREGKDYVTVRDPESGKQIGGDGRERAAAARRELERRRQRRAAYHRSRYGVGGRTGERPATARVAPAAGGRAGPFSRHCRRELGGDALTVDGPSSSRSRRWRCSAWTSRRPARRWRGSRTRRGERLVVLPAGTLDSRPWTVGGRPALKLSSE